MTPDITERQHTRLGVENQTEFQTNAAFEQTAAKSPDTEPGVKMRCAETIAHGSNDFADLPPLPFR
jgi:hypothetical protein